MIVIYCDSCHNEIPDDNEINVSVVMLSTSIGTKEALHLCMTCWGKTVIFLSGNVPDNESRFDEIHKMMLIVEKEAGQESTAS
jgi:hypothetical protein